MVSNYNMEKKKEKSEFYIKTLLALYKADEISLDKLRGLLKKELGDINWVVYDNIERVNKNWNYDFIDECYKWIMDNLED
mgnify:CR=1 FL=1